MTGGRYSEMIGLTVRGNTKLLRFTLYAVCQKDHCKSIGERAAEIDPRSRKMSSLVLPTLCLDYLRLLNHRSPRQRIPETTCTEKEVRTRVYLLIEKGVLTFYTYSR